MNCPILFLIRCLIVLLFRTKCCVSDGHVPGELPKYKCRYKDKDKDKEDKDKDNYHLDQGRVALEDGVFDGALAKRDLADL